MPEKLVHGAVSFGERLACSQAFADLFRDGMALVEEAAAYLEGPGRGESKKLTRSAAFAYAAESWRLTPRLMQIASGFCCTGRSRRARCRSPKPAKRRRRSSSRPAST